MNGSPSGSRKSRIVGAPTSSAAHGRFALAASARRSTRCGSAGAMAHPLGERTCSLTTCATRRARSFANRRSRPSSSARSRCASARTPRSSASSTPCCCMACDTVISTDSSPPGRTTRAITRSGTSPPSATIATCARAITRSRSSPRISRTGTRRTPRPTPPNASTSASSPRTSCPRSASHRSAAAGFSRKKIDRARRIL